MKSAKFLAIYIGLLACTQMQGMWSRMRQRTHWESELNNDWFEYDWFESNWRPNPEFQAGYPERTILDWENDFGPIPQVQAVNNSAMINASQSVGGHWVDGRFLAVDWEMQVHVLVKKIDQIEAAKKAQIIKEQTSCAICIEELQESDKRNALACGHVFHAVCLEAWLKTSRTCPTCRASVAGENNNNNNGQ